MKKLGFQNNDPAHVSFQVIEDIACGYWYSQALFTALELELFTLLSEGDCSAEELAAAANCHLDELSRLLTALVAMGLLDFREGHYGNAQVSSLYLVCSKSDYMGDFFLYRQYMRDQWQGLTAKVSKETPPAQEELSYEQKIFKYVRAMDMLVRQKAQEIARLVTVEGFEGPVLDVGGGGGGLVRTLRNMAGEVDAELFDLPEVIGAAEKLYPDPADWQGITAVGGDFREHIFSRKYGVIFLSNFLHAYGAEEAEILLAKATDMLLPGGFLVIHDYFPDQGAVSPQKGSLYDLAMMLNTYNGVCHDAKTVRDWCSTYGLASLATVELATDSTVILAARSRQWQAGEDPLVTLGKELGLKGLVAIDPKDVVTASWVQEKCRTGCERYDKGLQCPPYTRSHEETRKLLDEYSRAYLVRGTPPGKDFHSALLTLEKKAFLAGHHKALVFGAGPCTLCPACPEDGRCRLPHLARPAMEATGIDVYSTAGAAGIDLKPVQQKGNYITYIGLLLVE